MTFESTLPPQDSVIPPFNRQAPNEQPVVLPIGKAASTTEALFQSARDKFSRQGRLISTQRTREVYSFSLEDSYNHVFRTIGAITPSGGFRQDIWPEIIERIIKRREVVAMGEPGLGKSSFTQALVEVIEHFQLSAGVSTHDRAFRQAIAKFNQSPADWDSQHWREFSETVLSDYNKLKEKHNIAIADIVGLGTKDRAVSTVREIAPHAVVLAFVRIPQMQYLSAWIRESIADIPDNEVIDFITKRGMPLHMKNLPASAEEAGAMVKAQYQKSASALEIQRVKDDVNKQFDQKESQRLTHNPIPPSVHTFSSGEKEEFLRSANGLMGFLFEDLKLSPENTYIIVNTPLTSTRRGIEVPMIQ